MNLFAKSLGLVSEGDMVSLSPNLRVVGVKLVDDITGAEHDIARGVQDLVDVLRLPVPVELWLSLCRQHDISTVRALDILHFINSIAGLRTVRHKSFWQHGYIPIFFRGGSPVLTGKRYVGNFWGLLSCVSVGLIQLFPVVGVLVILWYGLGVLSPSVCIALVAGLMTTWLSTMVHEAVHAVIARRYKSNVCFVRRGLRVGTLHAPLDPWQELTSAVCGPLAGVMTVALCALLSIVVGRVSLIPALMPITLFHILSWLPTYGDGVALLQSWRRRHA